MPKFEYTATTPTGEIVRGTTRADTAGAARTILLEKQVTPISVAEKRSRMNFELTKRKIKPAALMQFSRQLSAFLRAGIPVLDGIRILNEEITDKGLRIVLPDIMQALRGGDVLSAGIARHVDRFPGFYVEMIRAAEVTGALDDVLEQLAAYLERDLEASRKIKSALAYPVIIMIMSIVTVGVLTAFVLPRFKTFFESLDAKLPLPTRMLISFTAFITTWWWLILSVGGGLLILLLAFLRTGVGRRTRDQFTLRIPFVGVIIRNIIIERFCRMLASLVRAGVPLPRSLDLVADATRHTAFDRRIRQVREEMVRGEGLSGPLMRAELFPNAMTQMVRVGEDTGTLDQQLEAAGTFYERELDYRIKHLTTLFEPAIIICMGAAVGFVAIALISAMYGIFDQVDL